MNKWILICLGITTGLTLGYAASTYTPDFMPAGLHLGVSESTDALNKEGLIKKVTKNAAGDAVIGSDLVERINRNTMGLYYIREGKLAGYMRTFNKLYADSAQIGGEIELILPNKTSGFIKDTDEDILRTDGNLKAKVVKAQKWISPDDQFNLYVIVSDLEVTGVVFDTKLMSKGDFFISADKKSNISEKLDKIRNTNALNTESHPSPSKNKADINFIIMTTLGALLAAVLLARYVVIKKT